MKSNLCLKLLLLILLSILLLKNTYAQDYRRLNLPNGAKARIGKGIINDMQLSQDGTRLAIASSIGVWLYDVNTGIETPLISGHMDSVRLVAFSPNGKILASNAYDKTIRIWDTETGKTIQILTIPKENLSPLNFLNDEKTLIVVNWKGVVSLWNTSTGKQLDTYNSKASGIRIKGVVWKRASTVSIKDNNDVIIAVGNKDGTISIKNGKTTKEIRKLVTQTDASYQYPIQHKHHFSMKFTPDRHEYPIKWVNTVEFTQDGNTLISLFNYQNANWDGSASFREGSTEIWDVNTGEQLALLPDHIDAEFSGDGKYLTIMGYGKCTIWDIASRREIVTFPETDTVKFSGDGKTLVQITKDSYTLWDIAAHREINKINPNFDEFNSVTERYLLSHDGSVFVSVKVNGIVNVWHTRSKKPLLTLTSGFTEPFTTIGFSPNGKMFAAGDLFGNIRIWNTNTLNKRHSIKTDHSIIRTLTFAKDNKTIISINRGDMEVWDIISGVQEKAYIIPDAKSGEYAVSFKDNTRFSRDNSSIFVQNSEKLLIKTVNGTEIWDILNAKHLYTFTKVGRTWRTIVSDGNIIADGSGSATHLWNLKTGEEITTLRTSKSLLDKFLDSIDWRNFNVYALAFTPDGKTIAVGTGNKEIHLWDVATQQRIKTLKGQKHAVCELAFSPNGSILASGDTEGKIHLWDITTGRNLTIYEGRKINIMALAFSPDGETLASISDYHHRQDGTILLWDVPTK